MDLSLSLGLLTDRQGAIDSDVYGHTQTLKRHRNRLKLLNVQIKMIEQEMKEIIFKNEVLKRKIDYLRSIPGVSFISATTIVGEILGFESIVNAKQHTSYASFDIVLKESGKTKISKRGDSHIRAVLHMPSMTGICYNTTLKQFYDRFKPKKEKQLVP